MKNQSSVRPTVSLKNKLIPIILVSCLVTAFIGVIIFIYLNTAVTPKAHATGQTVIWFEDFDLPNGTTVDNGATAWNSTGNPGAGGYWQVVNGQFEGRNLQTEAVWSSQVIDISNFKDVKITLSTGSATQANLEITDYINIYYKLNGGSEELFYSQTGLFAGTSVFSGCGTGLNGSTLQIIVRSLNSTSNEQYYFDNVKVYSEPMAAATPKTLYSRGSGNWNSTSNWSTTANGPSCGCSPATVTNADVRILCGHVINVNAAATAQNVTIYNGGTLRWTQDVTLTISNSGFILVNDEGVLSENGRVATISFTGPTNTFTTHNSATTGSSLRPIVDNIFLTNTNTSLTINGTGLLAVTNQTRYNGIGQSCTNNITMSTNSVYYSTVNCTFINNGTLSISDDLMVQDNLDDGNIFTNNSGNTVTITDDINTNNADFTLNNYGTLSNDQLSNVVAASAFNNFPGATWNYLGNGIDTDTKLYCNNSTNTFNYGGGNITILAPQSNTYGNLTLSGTGTKTSSFTSDIVVLGNLTISGTAQLDVAWSSDNIQLEGNWINTSSNLHPFLEGDETITFRGSNAQTLTNSNGETFYNVVLNKPSQNLTLSNSMTITNSMNFTQGIVNSSNGAWLIFNDNATTNGGDADSYVVGPVRKIGNDAFTFPVGDGTKWARIAITAPNLVTDIFTAQYFHEAFSDLTVSASGWFEVSRVEFWRLDRTSGTSVENVQLFWEDATHSGIIDYNDLSVGRYNGQDWVDQGRSSGVNASPGSITSNTTNAFNTYFTFASLSSTNPLPVKLLSFEGTADQNKSQLSWVVTSEINNDYFTIEKSKDGIDFEELGTKKGAGNSATNNSYTYTDNSPYSGRNYYRLKQTDFNGRIEFIGLIKVDMPASYREAQSFQVSPNPITNNQAKVKGQGFANSKSSVVLKIMDLQGNLVWKNTYTEANFGEGIEISPDLPSGTYVFVVSNSNRNLSKRVIVR